MVAKKQNEETGRKVRSLVLDLETFPTEAYVWGLFDQNIGLNQIKRTGGVVSWAAKWVDADETELSSINITTKRAMVKEIWKMLDEADEVIGWNSNSFDLKLLNAEFAMIGLPPPSPYKKIDLMRIVKNNMKFVSSKLEHVAGQFGVGSKVKHSGFDLWLGCMAKDQASWDLFHEYNVQDVLLTEKLYHKLRPWIKTGLNRSLLTGNCVCHTCGSANVQQRGWYYTKAFKWKQYQCKDCGAWNKSDERLPRDTKKNPLLRPIQ